MNYKDDVLKCFNENYPHNCPKGSFALTNRITGGADMFKLKARSTGSYCKYYDYCHRKFQRRVAK